MQTPKPPYDWVERETIIRDQLSKLLANPASMEDRVAALANEWRADHQATHEQAYSDGAEGILA